MTGSHEVVGSIPISSTISQIVSLTLPAVKRRNWRIRDMAVLAVNPNRELVAFFCAILPETYAAQWSSCQHDRISQAIRLGRPCALLDLKACRKAKILG